MISVILFKIGKHSDIHLSFIQIVGAWRDFTGVTKMMKNFFLWEHLRVREQWVYFCEHKQWSNLSWGQRTLHKFSAGWNLSSTEEAFHQVIWQTPPRHDNGRNRGSANPSSLQSIVCQTTWASMGTLVDCQGDLKLSNPTLWKNHEKKLKAFRLWLLFTFASAFGEEFLRASLSMKRQGKELACFQKHL